MKAVGVFPQRRTVELVSFDEPNITSPEQVKIRVLQVGVCGTDREICDFEYGTPPEGSEYLVLGHESLGEVVEAGGSKAFQPETWWCLRCAGPARTPIVSPAGPAARISAIRVTFASAAFAANTAS